LNLNERTETTGRNPHNLLHPLIARRERPPWSWQLRSGFESPLGIEKKRPTDRPTFRPTGPADELASPLISSKILGQGWRAKRSGRANQILATAKNLPNNLILLLKALDFLQVQKSEVSSNNKFQHVRSSAASNLPA
jgi:hypothetical protein